MSEQTPSFTVYFDTNVVSYIESGRVQDFLRTLTKNGHKLVVSDIVLEELPSGHETQIFAEHPFLYLLAHEAAYLGGMTNFYRSVEPANSSNSMDAIELFLRGILRSAAGSKSVGDLNSLLRNSIEAITEEIMQDLPDGTDQRLIDQLADARIRFREGFDLLPSVPSPIVTREEMEAHRMSPKHLNNIRPPSVVSKVMELYPDSIEWIRRLLFPFGVREDIKSRIQELCLALILVGFARDRDIGRDNDERSDRGSRSQFRDISHICAAAVCDIFVTSDKRCAKLAYAVFEALNLRTAVTYLVFGKSNEVSLLVVGSEYWP
jgi:hypothetical protein